MKSPAFLIVTNRPYYKWKASTRFVNRRGLALLLDKVWGRGNIGQPVTSTPSLLYKRGILIWALPLLLYYIKRCSLTLFIIGSSQPPIHSHFNIARIFLYSFIGIFQRFPHLDYISMVKFRFILVWPLGRTGLSIRSHSIIHVIKWWVEGRIHLIYWKHYLYKIDFFLFVFLLYS